MLVAWPEKCSHKEDLAFETHERKHIWTITEAKARLPEILRLADEQGPQRVGIRKTYVIVPEKDWKPNSTTAEPSKDRMPMGKWLVENTPRGTNLELPDRRETDRPNPFLEDTDR